MSSPNNQSAAANRLRYAEFELSHVEPQDNVYQWFKTAITEMATYGQHDEQFGLSELTDGWKLLSKHGPGSPEVTQWFADRNSMPPYPLGEEQFHPHQGSSAHQSTIEHFHRFQHEFNGHVESTVSANVAAARQENRQLKGLDPENRAAGPLSPGPKEDQASSPTQTAISPQRPAHLARQDRAAQNRSNTHRHLQ